MNKEQLNELMREYHEIICNKNEACKFLDIQIENLIETRDAIAEPFQQKLFDIEFKIRLPMFDRKESFVCQYGKINYRKGVVRRIWNLDALDLVCKSKPEIKNEIWHFREEKVSEPTITIKVEE